MAIGDDLQILLGMVPIRDRAGIARGTMADAAAAAANNNPHAEGQTLTRQGFDRPPAFALPPGMLTGSDGAADIRLPDGVNTEYASGGKLSPVKAPSLGKGPVPGTPTADSERVVASSPMAAPSPGVVRGSEIMRQAMETQKRQELMQQLFHGLGQIVGGIRGENVPARAAGAGAGGSNDLNNLKTLIEMRNQEDQQATALALRAQGIDTLQRKFKLSPEDAALQYDSGNYKEMDKPENLRKRRADELAGQTMMDLMKPENVDALSKRLGQPPDVIRSSIREGKIGAKDLADIESTQATTQGTISTTRERDLKAGITASDFGVREEARRNPEAKAAELTNRLKRPVFAGEVSDAAATEPTWQAFITQNTQGGQGEIAGKAATTAKTQQETGIKAAEIAEYEGAKANPLDVMKRYDLSPSQYEKAIADPASWNAFKLSQSGAGAADYSTYQAEKAAALKADPSKTFPDYAKWKQSQTPRTIETPGEKGEAGTVTHLATELAKEHARIKSLQKDLEIDQPMAQGLFRENQLGGSKLAEMTLSGRKILGAMFLPEGTYDDKVVQAETFFNTVRERVLARAREFPGALSNDDRIFLEKLSGTMEMSSQTIRNLMTIREKITRAEITRFNRDIAAHKANTDSPGLQGAAKPYEPVSLPAPGKLIKENFARQGGQEFLRKAAADGTLDTPEFISKFEERFGAQSLPFFRAKSGL